MSLWVRISILGPRAVRGEISHYLQISWRHSDLPSRYGDRSAPAADRRTRRSPHRARHHSIPSRVRRGPTVEEQLLRGHHPNLDRYAAGLKQRALELQRIYPSGPFLAAVEQALRFGLVDLARLETLILRHAAGDFFNLNGSGRQRCVTSCTHCSPSCASMAWRLRLINATTAYQQLSRRPLIRAKWYELFQQKHLVDALLDRLQHRCNHHPHRRSIAAKSGTLGAPTVSQSCINSPVSLSHYRQQGVAVVPAWPPGFPRAGAQRSKTMTSHRRIFFELPHYWTQEQAYAVYELLTDLPRASWQVTIKR
jgi:hypothetical protein